jgi:hypothetical protein
MPAAQPNDTEFSVEAADRPGAFPIRADIMHGFQAAHKPAMRGSVFFRGRCGAAVPARDVMDGKSRMRKSVRGFLRKCRSKVMNLDRCHEFSLMQSELIAI